MPHKKTTILVIEDEPSLYLYRLRSGAHEQTGIAGCYALALLYIDMHAARQRVFARARPGSTAR